MLKAWIQTIRKRIPCYCHIEWKKPNELASHYDDEQCIPHSESSTKPSNNVKYVKEQKREYVKLRVVTYPTSVL
jgi:hypothetical protein